MFRRIAREKLKFYNVFISIQFFNALVWESAAFIHCHILTGRKWIPETGTRGAFWEKLASIYFQDPPLENTLHEVNFSTYIVIPRSRVFDFYNSPQSKNF